MLSFNLEGPGDVLRGVGRRCRDRRLQANLTQAGLAYRAGVSLGTLKLFERTGKAGFQTVVSIAFALGAQQEFGALFPPAPPTSLDEDLDKTERKRGRRT